MSEAYVSGISYSAYSSTTTGTGYINLRDNNMSTTVTLDQEDTEKLRDIAAEIINKHKTKFAERIAAIEVSAPQITYADKAKAIEADTEIPF